MGRKNSTGAFLSLVRQASGWEKACNKCGPRCVRPDRRAAAESTRNWKCLFRRRPLASLFRALPGCIHRPNALLHLTKRPVCEGNKRATISVQKKKKERGGFGRDVMDNRLIQLCRLSLSISGFRIWRCTVVVGHRQVEWAALGLPQQPL